jgi:hypothetical protein
LTILDTLPDKNAQDRLDDGGLADTRTAGHDRRCFAEALRAPKKTLDPQG